MTTIVKAAGAAQFLSFVPRMLGFTPTESLVLVPFAGNRTIGAMRLDLPATDDLDAFASTCLGMVCRVENADAVALVVYTRAPFAAGPPRGDLAQALFLQADSCGLRLVDALCVAGGAWGSYLDPECPPGGRPLEDLDDAAHGHLPSASGDQSSGAGLPDVSESDAADVAAALAALRRYIRALAGDRPAQGAGQQHPDRIDPRTIVTAGLLDDLPTLYEDALRPDAAGIDSSRLVALAWGLARPGARDVALVQWCSGFAAGDEALSAQLRWEAGEPYPAHIATRMWGEGDRPDADRLIRALDLARRIAAVTPRHDRPGALASCAWLSWALGRSTHAATYAKLALGIDPEHGLSEIVLSFVNAGHLPEWAFQRPPTHKERG